MRSDKSPAPFNTRPMPNFNYRAVDKTGKASEGELNAPDKKQALQQLALKGLQPIRLDLYSSASDKGVPEKARRKQTPTAPSQKDAGTVSKRVASSRKIRLGSKQAQPFLENLLQLHGSGLPVADSVQLMQKRLKDPKLQFLASKLRTELVGGRSLAEAMRQQKEVFSPNVVHLVEAGEATGNLKPILKNCLEHMESHREVTQEIRSGLSYPTFICIMALGIGLFTITSLIPKLQELTAQMGGEPNQLTRFMIGLSDFAVFQLPIIVGLLVAGLIALYRWRQTDAGRLKTDAWLLGLPFAGKVIQNIELNRSLSTLQLLLENGINSVEAMRLSSYAVSNRVLRDSFLLARTRLQDGASFARAFESADVLPQNDIDLVNIGESTGSLVSTLARISELHKDQLSRRFKQLTVAISALALGLAVSLVALLILSIVFSLQDVSQSILAN